MHVTEPRGSVGRCYLKLDMLGQGCEKSEEVPVNSRELLRCSSTQPFAKAFNCRVRLRPNIAVGRPARVCMIVTGENTTCAGTRAYTETDWDQKNEGTREGGRDTDKERRRGWGGETGGELHWVCKGRSITRTLRPARSSWLSVHIPRRLPHHRHRLA